MKGLAVAITMTFGMLGLVGYFTAVSADGNWSDGHTKRMRGSDSYYDQDQSQQREVEPLNVRIMSDNPAEDTYLVLDMDYGYRLGREIDATDAEEKIEARDVRLRDRLLIEIADMEAEELDTLVGKFKLKRLLRDIIQEEVFPNEMARVQSVWFKQILVQRTRKNGAVSARGD